MCALSASASGPSQEGKTKKEAKKPEDSEHWVQRKFILTHRDRAVDFKFIQNDKHEEQAAEVKKKDPTMVASPRPLTPPNRRIRCPSVHQPR